MMNITTINEKRKHVSDGLIVQKNTLQCLNQEYLLLKMSCEQTNACIKKMKSDQDECEKRLQQITQLLEDLHYISYDGTLIWKITNVDQKFAEAQSGKQTSIESPVFYSSPYGYKMRARLFLNGDGDGEGTHMSIFLVLFKGDYDAIIWWPFYIPVAFCLFDQTGQAHHIDSFDPDTKSSSFQRPTAEKNIASGIPKFCPLAVIKSQGNCYVRDDTMFIKIMLDFGETPREVLPCTLSVNPGLPTYMQEAIRCMEIEKYKQAREALIAEIVRNDQEILRRGLIPTDRSVLPETTQQQSTSTANFEGGASWEDISPE
ncbi:unnamed protein product [Rotaria sordida]|uniref:MATH domain-containing protein n=1 Tax=Rotaria sordida TaxID=392033 RepID=A0A814KUW4_9BILA|nr:unnamed protein product [Rotaria sordida]CAF3894249.1 unnamed protein product [Rotaria sordida]